MNLMLNSIWQSRDEYAIVKLTGKSKLILEEDETVMMKMAKEQESAKAAGEKKEQKEQGAAPSIRIGMRKLFESARTAGEIARKEGVPPYIVSDNRLHMCHVTACG